MSNFASADQIRRWPLVAKEHHHATHVLIVRIVRDGLDYTDYPGEVHSGESVKGKYNAYSNMSTQRVLEVYALHLDIEEQLAEDCAMHLESPPQPEEVGVGVAAPTKPAHTTTGREAWEYVTVSTSGEEGPILSKLGADGWELVAVLNYRTETRLYFKRRKRA